VKSEREFIELDIIHHLAPVVGIDQYVESDGVSEGDE
jgi:hypothetical protein